MAPSSYNPKVSHGKGFSSWHCRRGLRSGLFLLKAD
jgi:hypothetical protein